MQDLTIPAWTRGWLVLAYSHTAGAPFHKSINYIIDFSSGRGSEPPSFNIVVNVSCPPKTWVETTKLATTIDSGDSRFKSITLGHGALSAAI